MNQAIEILKRMGISEEITTALSEEKTVDINQVVKGYQSKFDTEISRLKTDNELLKQERDDLFKSEKIKSDNIKALESQIKTKINFLDKMDAFRNQWGAGQLSDKHREYSDLIWTEVEKNNWHLSPDGKLSDQHGTRVITDDGIFSTLTDLVEHVGNKYGLLSNRGLTPNRDGSGGNKDQSGDKWIGENPEEGRIYEMINGKKVDRTASATLAKEWDL